MKMNLRSKLLASVAVLFTLAVFLGGSGLSAVSSLGNLFKATLEGPVHKSDLAQSILLDTSQLISSQRGVILAAYAKNPSQIESAQEEFRKSAAAIQKTLESLRPLLETEEGRSLTSEVAAKLSEWNPFYSEVVKQAISGNPDQANKIRIEATAPLYRKMTEAANRLVVLEGGTVASSKAEVSASQSRTLWVMIALFVAYLVVNGFIGVVVHTSTLDLRLAVAELSEGASQVSGAARQVASGSQNLAQGSSKQAASIEETSASTEEINSMAKKNSENSRSAAALVSKAQQQFSKTNESLEQMVVARAEITAGSDKISKIIRVIDEIAFQTNILALNAAV
jgi:methyl-accepting chemotaxis protein/methyl-accepting chemotaxis protein-1 (serine sensor receptor)